MSQFWTETGREFKTDGAVVLKERLPKEVRLNGTCSSGADDDRNDRVLLRVVICRLRYSGTDVWRDLKVRTPHSTQYRSFRRRSSQPITWLILTNKTVQENTDKRTQYKSEVNNLKYSKAKPPWFSCMLQHSARKRGGLILYRPRAHTGRQFRVRGWVTSHRVYPSATIAAPLPDRTVLPATRQMRHFRLIPAEAGTRFRDPGGMQGWVGLERVERIANWKQCNRDSNGQLSRQYFVF